MLLILSIIIELIYLTVLPFYHIIATVLTINFFIDCLLTTFYAKCTSLTTVTEHTSAILTKYMYVNLIIDLILNFLSFDHNSFLNELRHNDQLNAVIILVYQCTAKVTSKLA